MVMPVPNWPGGPQKPPPGAGPQGFDAARVECFNQQACGPGGVFFQPPAPVPANAVPLNPNDIATGIERGIRRVARDKVIVTTDELPHIAVPFRATWESDYMKAVISVPLGGNAGAVAGALALAVAAGFNLKGVVVPVVQQDPAGDPVVVQTFTVPNYTNLTLKKFGVRVNSWGGLRALRWSIWINQFNVLTEQEINFADPSRPMEFFALARQNDVVTVMVRNLDPFSGFLVEPFLSGWRYPVNQSDDSQGSTVENLGPNANGEWR